MLVGHRLNKRDTGAAVRCDRVVRYASEPMWSVPICRGLTHGEEIIARPLHLLAVAVIAMVGPRATAAAHLGGQWTHCMGSSQQSSALSVSLGVASVGQVNTGNTVTHKNLVRQPRRPPGIIRLNRDVLDLAGVGGHGWLALTVSAETRLATRRLAVKDYFRTKASGLKVDLFSNPPQTQHRRRSATQPWDDLKTKIWNEVNSAPSKASFDAVIDLDAVTGAPNYCDRTVPAFAVMGMHPRWSLRLWGVGQF